MAGNDDDNSDYSCGLTSRVTFSAVETETCIVIVTGWEYSVGTFTLSVQCRDPSYGASDSGSDSESESVSWSGDGDGPGSGSGGGSGSGSGSGDGSGDGPGCGA